MMTTAAVLCYMVTTIVSAIVFIATDSSLVLTPDGLGCTCATIAKLLLHNYSPCFVFTHTQPISIAHALFSEGDQILY